ncbi:MAG: hypothetical protein GXP24_10385 [Planctomycetes bacterium]|nr:hypothetical protein [Planctomycetota bacterium]
MPSQVQLIAGPARCGKTQRLLRLYRQRLGERRLGGDPLGKCCWLAPNQTALAQLQEGLVAPSDGDGADAAILQPNLFTFASFAESLILGSHRRIRSISPSQKRRLLQQVIQAALKQRQLEHFARVASTPGFVRQVDEFIAELKRTDVWPEVFEQRCQQRPRSDRRSREFSHLYSAYQQLLHRGELYDREGRFWAAREILAESTAGATSQLYDWVVVNGFNDFTAAQYDILRLLGECCSRLVISLTCETASEEAEEALFFAKSSETRARLQDIFPQLEIETLTAPPLSALPFFQQTLPQQTSSQQTPTLQHLQQQLFRETNIPKAEGGSGKAEIQGVEILAANSELGEVEAVAERIKALLLSERAQMRATQPQEIVVVCRGGENTATVIDAVFPDFGIPYTSELRPRLDSEPLVRALLTLLHLHQEDWPFQTLLDVIGNRLFTKFDAPNAIHGLAPDGLASRFPPRVAIEHCIRSAQLPSGRVALLEQLEYRRDVATVEPSGGTDQRGAGVSTALGELRWLDQVFSALPVEAPIDGWVLALEQLLSQLGALASTAQTSVAWKLLRRGLLEIERVDAWSLAEKQLLTLAELQELIVAVAREQRLPAANDAVGRVRILSAESARKLSTKHLFLTGLSEQAFSAAPTSQTATTDDLQLPAEDLLEALPATAVGHNDAMLLFYELVTRPTESLTLSYPALDAKGEPLTPSPLLTDLERSAGEGRIARSTMALGQMLDLDTTPHSVGSFRRQAVAQALDGKPRWLAGMISTPDYVRAGSSILNGIDCIAARSVREGYGPFEGLLLSSEVQAALAQRYDAKHLWSPSRLEGYAACPFRYFAEQILKLEPLGELSLRNDPRRRGSLLHQVLATIHEQLSGADALGKTASDADAEELVKRFLATLDAAVKTSPLRGIAQSLREIERREIEAWASDYAEQETSYRNLWKHLDEPPRPAHFEVRFGPETRSSAGETADRASTSVPFVLDLGDEQICLTGAIDRVDIGRVGGVTVFNIIDYKSGKAVKLSLDKVRSGHQLQLPLYALAAEQLLLADQEAVALATGYWNIRGKGFESKRGGSLQLRELTDQTLKTSDDWKKLQPEILARLQELISGIYNQDEHCTQSCSLSTVCRVSQVRSLEKVWPPPQANPDRKGAGEE